VLAFRGEPDRAFQWLEKAVQNHDLTVGSISRKLISSVGVLRRRKLVQWSIIPAACVPPDMP